MTVRQIADLLEGDVIGDDALPIEKLAKIEEAGKGSLSFLSNPKYEKYIETTAASAVLVARTFDHTKHRKLPPALIKVDDPYTSFVIALESAYPQKEHLLPGVHPTAVIASTADIGKNCAIGAYSVIGEQCVVGDNTKIHPHVVIGNETRIGNSCTIYAHVTIREQCVVGNRVILQPGVVIGSDGFGFAPKKDGSYRKIPQLGIVVLEDDVEIQANTCIDRATLGETRIKAGTKIDNLVQIAHNVVIGENSVVAGRAGIAGSTKLGKQNVLGGAASIAGHLTFGDRVTIAAASGVSKSVPEGETWFGYPAKEINRARRMEGALRQLPELLVSIRALEQKILELEELLKQHSHDHT